MTSDPRESLVETSPYNTHESFAADLQFADDIELLDTTLRDGEQTPGVVFSPSDKVALARRLDDIGIDRIEAGNPVISERDRDAVDRIAGEDLDADVYVLVRAIQDDIDIALECDVDGVLVYSPSSDLEIERKFNWDREDATAAPLAATQYARDHGLDVSFFPFDTTRADIGFVEELVQTIDGEGLIDSVIVVDTVGCANPHAFQFLVDQLETMTDLPIEAHCHNDFGLATANALFAASAGAEVIHTTINGLGERTGNPALDEVVAGLKHMYDQDIDVDLTEMRSLSKEVERRSNQDVAVDKPLTGDNMYTFSSGLVIDGLRRDPFTFIPVHPSVVGQDFTYVLGKNSGLGSIELKLEELGVDPETLSEAEREALVTAVKEVSETQERPLEDHEFEAMVGDRHPELLAED